MVNIPEDLTGRVFSRLTVLGPAPKQGKNLAWLCLCKCGTEHSATGGNLKAGTTRSCGCLRQESLTAKRKAIRTTDLPEYNVWRNMLTRCHNSANHAYRWYGARGVTVCDQWRTSFENFYANMGSKPSPKHTLDRIDNDGPYSPENCRWATMKEQARNRRNNRLLTFKGQTLCITEWSEQTGLTCGVIGHRLKRGWSVERTLTE